MVQSVVCRNKLKPQISLSSAEDWFFTKNPPIFLKLQTEKMEEGWWGDVIWASTVKYIFRHAVLLIYQQWCNPKAEPRDDSEQEEWYISMDIHGYASEVKLPYRTWWSLWQARLTSKSTSLSGVVNELASSRCVAGSEAPWFPGDEGDRRLPSLITHDDAACNGPALHGAWYIVIRTSRWTEVANVSAS